MNLQVIELNSQRLLTTKQLAEIYETEINNIINNFNNHKENFIKGKHYILLEGEKLREFKREINNIDIVKNNINKLYLWTERGASRHCKILDTDKAWEQFDNLEETYFIVKETNTQLEGLSPQLQVLINLETRQKELEQKVIETDNKLEGIKDIVALSTTNWREDSSTLIKHIAQKQGGFEHIRLVREEVYKQLDKRMGASMKTRVTNKRRRMADEGICKSKRDRLNTLDIISEDKKAIEIYVAIVKEMAIKNGVDVNGIEGREVI